MSEPFALYVHVPWCRHVCPYCDFNVYAAARPPEAEYTAALAAELAAHAAGPPWEGRSAATVYLGGGTPSLFTPAAIAALLAAIARTVGIAGGAEVTLEANPGTVSRDTLAAMRASGVNRLSLGTQSFDARQLRTLGRDHAPADTAAAVDAARTAGFENVSLDLIFAVPGQGLDAWEADLTAAIALGPEQVSTYALTWEEGTPFHTRRAGGRLAAVADDDEAAMAAVAAERLEAAGLARYEISSFARPGFESRHNTAYWTGSDYLGLGAGAHSYTRTPRPGRRWTNERTPARYQERIRTERHARAAEEVLTEAQARGEFCFTGLRRLAGVDLTAFEHRFGTPVTAAFPHVIELAADGLVGLTPARLKLTPRGLLFADTVAATFV
jgi:putative oxygen-independent coproporphyrinogen III oxidase